MRLRLRVRAFAIQERVLRWLLLLFLRIRDVLLPAACAGFDGLRLVDFHFVQLGEGLIKSGARFPRVKSFARLIETTALFFSKVL